MKAIDNKELVLALEELEKILKKGLSEKELKSFFTLIKKMQENVTYAIQERM